MKKLQCVPAEVCLRFRNYFPGINNAVTAAPTCQLHFQMPVNCALRQLLPIVGVVTTQPCRPINVSFFWLDYGSPMNNNLLILGGPPTVVWLARRGCRESEDAGLPE